MVKKSRKHESAPVVELAPVVVEAPTLADLDLGGVDAEVMDDIVKRNSVVKAKYKVRYAHRAKEQGLGKKAQRSAWDWLAQQLAGECLDQKARISIEKFTRILDLNGVDHSKWTNRSKGWEGRFRMTGRLALQRVVAEAGKLVVEGDELEAPADWVAKYKN